VAVYQDYDWMEWWRKHGLMLSAPWFHSQRLVMATAEHAVRRTHPLQLTRPEHLRLLQEAHPLTTLRCRRLLVH
jgi:hypothetical protein